MKKKLIILNILMIFQNNQLMDGPNYADLAKTLGLFIIPPCAVFVLYGIGNDYYWDHIANPENAIKKKEESLKHPNLQTEYWQKRLKKEIVELKERLAKEQKEKKKKEEHKQAAELAVNEQKPMNILPPQAANTQDGSHSFFVLKQMILNQSYNLLYYYLHRNPYKIGVFEALPEGYENMKRMTTEKATQFFHNFIKHQKKECNMYCDSNWS